MFNKFSHFLVYNRFSNQWSSYWTKPNRRAIAGINIVRHIFGTTKIEFWGSKYITVFEKRAIAWSCSAGNKLVSSLRRIIVSTEHVLGIPNLVKSPNSEKLSSSANGWKWRKATVCPFLTLRLCLYRLAIKTKMFYEQNQYTGSNMRFKTRKILGA